MSTWIRFSIVSLVCLPLALACSKSSTTQASFESSSKSSASPFRSSSASSGSDEPVDAAEEAYRRDVSDSAAQFATTAGDVEVFQRDLSGIAESHGITDWESHDGTYLAIGSGLAMADLGEDGFGVIAVELVDKDARRLELVRLGYARQRSE